MESLTHTLFTKEQEMNNKHYVENTNKQQLLMKYEQTKIQNDQMHADKEMLQVKLNEAVRVATNAQRQCLSLEQSSADLQQRNQNYMKEHVVMRAELDSTFSSTMQEKRNAVEEHRNERKQRTLLEYEMEKMKKESETIQDVLTNKLTHVVQQQQDAERQVEQLKSTMRESKKGSMMELNYLKQALKEQRSQLELLSVSHVDLESERNRVALELSELQSGQEKVRFQMEEERMHGLRESALVLESVKRGAEEFSSVLRSGDVGGGGGGGVGDSPYRGSRGSTY